MCTAGSSNLEGAASIEEGVIVLRMDRVKTVTEEAKKGERTMKKHK